MKENQIAKWIPLLWVLLVGFLILTFANFWYINREANFDKQYLSYSAELRVLINAL